MSENEIGFLNENGISLEKAKDVLEKYERDHNGNFILKNGYYINVLKDGYFYHR